MGGLRRKTLQPVVHWPSVGEKMARAKAGFFPGRSSPLKFPLVARMSWRGLSAVTGVCYGLLPCDRTQINACTQFRRVGRRSALLQALLPLGSSRKDLM